jgi:hypothetical protein
LYQTLIGANDAVRNGQMDGILWLEEKEIIPDIDGANAVARNG